MTEPKTLFQMKFDTWDFYGPVLRVRKGRGSVPAVQGRVVHPRTGPDGPAAVAQRTRLDDMTEHSGNDRLKKQIAAHHSWANTTDRTGRTAPGRRAFDNTFLTKVDPDGLLTEHDRTRRANHLRKAHFREMALKSAQARRAKSSR